MPEDGIGIPKKFPKGIFDECRIMKSILDILMPFLGHRVLFRTIFIIIFVYSVVMLSFSMSDLYSEICCIYPSHDKIKTFAREFYYYTQPFAKGVISSLVAAFVVARAAFYFRSEIQRFFQTVDYISILTPIQLAIIPLLLAKSRSFTERENVEIDLDLGYTGRDALLKLKKLDESEKRHRFTLAVASNIAACFYFKSEFAPVGNGEVGSAVPSICILPFVKLSRHMKLVVLKNRTNDIDILKNSNDKIGYFEDTAQHHFLYAMGFVSEHNKNRLTKKESLLECLYALAKEEICCFALWEPHYLPLNNEIKFPDIAVLDADEYVWYLCLVARRSALNVTYAKKLYNIIKDNNNSCQRDISCGNVAQMADKCKAFMFSELTGINHENIAPEIQHDMSFSLDAVISDFK
jgi:hypothetical protein